MEIVIKYKGKDIAKFQEVMDAVIKRFQEKSKDVKDLPEVKVVKMSDRCFKFVSMTQLGLLGKLFGKAVKPFVKKKVETLKEEFEGMGVKVDVEVKI